MAHWIRALTAKTNNLSSLVLLPPLLSPPSQITMETTILYLPMVQCLELEKDSLLTSLKN